MCMGNLMKNQYCSYYTNSDHITNYMVNMLGIKKDHLVLEPSAGEGVFIDKILETNTPLHIDALDIDQNAISKMKAKYTGLPMVSVRETDTLLDDKLNELAPIEIWLKNADTLTDRQLDFFSKSEGHYDRIIGNPPYGAWQEHSKREILKKKYQGMYVKETYTLFLLRCLSLLKVEGKLSFIVPDTFLFLNMHRKLREILFTSSKIEEILLFPSKFFPGVSFGYSNLSIITLGRSNREDAENNIVRILKGFNKPDELDFAFCNNLPDHIIEYKVKQSKILNNPDNRLIIADREIQKIIEHSNCSLGDIAKVVTGFYCGDNKKFIRARSSEVKGAKGYSIIDTCKVYEDMTINGIDIEEAYIPYFKSSPKSEFILEGVDWFIRWDKSTIDFYKNDKKARFQNADFYFEKGVAIPMVKSSKIKAVIMEGYVFDQSIVGIFPNEKKHFKYLLAFMNSDLASRLIHAINPTANNSANYIKLIPFVAPNKSQLQQISEDVTDILKKISVGDSGAAKQIMSKINLTIEKIYFDSEKECYRNKKNYAIR